MSATATVRVMSPEEIAARAGLEPPTLQPPQGVSVFAERAMRLRQLAPGHAMGDFLLFMAQLAQAQQHALGRMPAVPVPDAAALDAAARAGRPPLAATDWPRDPAWHAVLHQVIRELGAHAPEAARPVLARLAAADEVSLERQADALLHGLLAEQDLASAPIVAAALQVYWTHLLLEIQRLHAGRPLVSVLGRTDDETTCPCCGSRPTASITRSVADTPGQRYLHCSLCNLQWHMVRIKCPSCLSTRALSYQSLDTLDSDAEAEAGSSRAAQAAVQAECCDDCHSYLKILHTERDPFVEPVADDLASLTLDLLISDTGLQRQGVNLMLLFGDPDTAPPPSPGGV